MAGDKAAVDRVNKGVLPRCKFCGATATCHGTYGGDTAFACDTCCGHGCEDGYCERIAHVDRPSPIDQLTDAGVSALLRTIAEEPKCE